MRPLITGMNKNREQFKEKNVSVILTLKLTKLFKMEEGGRPTKSIPRINSIDTISAISERYHETDSVLSKELNSAELENFAQILTKFVVSLNAIQSELAEVKQQLSPILSKLGKCKLD